MAYRILRSIKNRYGSTSEICVFNMTLKGLQEVSSPSSLMLNDRSRDCPGTCATCVFRGSRAIITEVQALVSKTSFGFPRRVATGFDYNRLCLILAVLEKKASFKFSNLDVYINVVGGLKLEDPSSDFPVALSLISALKNIVITDDIIAFGEIGLTGEIRSVCNMADRIKEAINIGFKIALTPYLTKSDSKKIKIIETRNVNSINKLSIWNS